MYKANSDVQTTIPAKELDGISNFLFNRIEHNDPESRARRIRHLNRRLKQQKVNSDTYLFYNKLINNFWVEQITQY